MLLKEDRRRVRHEEEWNGELGGKTNGCVIAESDASLREQGDEQREVLSLVLSHFRPVLTKQNRRSVIKIKGETSKKAMLLRKGLPCRMLGVRFGH
jgi:hypothetical protein